MITLIGDNQYTIDLELKRIKDEFSKIHPLFDLQKIYPDQFDIEEVKLKLNNYTFFSEPKLIIIVDPIQIINFDKLIDDLAKLSNSDNEIVLVIRNSKISQRFESLLKNKSQMIKLDKLSENDLLKWINQRVKEEQIKLSPQNIHYIHQKIGNNQLQIASELEKIKLLDDDVDNDLIDLIIDSNLSNTIFELIDFAFRDKSRAYQIYNNLRLQKIEAEQIIGLIIWQLHLIALVKYSNNKNIQDVASDTKISSFPLQKSLNLSKKITSDQLTKFVHQIKDALVRSKTETFELDQFLKNFILSLTFSF